MQLRNKSSWLLLYIRFDDELLRNDSLWRNNFMTSFHLRDNSKIESFVYSFKSDSDSSGIRKSDWTRHSLIRFIRKVLTCVVELENKTFWHWSSTHVTSEFISGHSQYRWPRSMVTSNSPLWLVEPSYLGYSSIHRSLWSVLWVGHRIATTRAGQLSK